MPLRNLLLDNLWLKLFALVLATLIWISIQIKINKAIQPPTSPMGAVSERVFDRHAVSVLTDAENKAAFKLDPSEVSITVKGNITVVETLLADDIQAFVDLTQPPPGPDFINKVAVHTPPDVVLVQVVPPNVRVQRLIPRLPAR
jgi:YbbR domain-containing protein